MARFRRCTDYCTYTDGPKDLGLASPARERLAYDELMAHQLTLALARHKERRVHGQISQATGKLQSKVLAKLPYRPTGAQQRAITEISMIWRYQNA